MSRPLTYSYLLAFWLTRQLRSMLRREPSVRNFSIGASSERSAAAGKASRRPRVLIVHPYPIIPPYHGGGVRNFNLIQRLAKHCDLYLYVYSMIGDDPIQREALGPYCKKIWVHRRDPVPPPGPWDLMPRGAQFLRFQRVAEDLRDIVDSECIDIVQLEFAEMAQYARFLGEAKVSLTELDLSFVTSRRRRKIDFHHRFGTDRDLWSDRLSWLKLFRFEVLGAEAVDRVHLMSDDDARTLARLMSDGSDRLRVMANGVDTELFRPPTEPVREPRILFLGSFGHTPNLDAVEFLLDEIWPLVRIRVPTASLSLVGAHPPDWIRDRAGLEGIEVLGTVESTLAEFQGHRALAAPVRVGSGTRLKILEAFSSGLPVVSTTIGAEGIACRHQREILIADQPGEFAEQLSLVLTDDALCDRLTTAGRQLAETRYDWNRTVESTMSSYRQLLGPEVEPAPPQPTSSDGVKPVDISVVIPTRNGGASLTACLGAIRAQQIDRSVELICVDSGSSESELAAIKALGARVVSIPPTEFNHGLTRDHGASLAGGEVLVFLNQDAIPVDRLWLHRLTDPLFRPGIYGAIQGGIRERIDVADRFYWDSGGSRFYFTSESDNWIAQHDGIGFSTVNAAIRRDLWREVRFGWAPIMEDKKWQRRIEDAGHRIGSVGTAAVYHSHNYDLASLARRCQSEGWGWQMLGESYRLRDAVRDICRRSILRDLWQGIRQRQIRSLAELAFPVVRPLALYWGNRWSGGVRLG